MGIFGEEARHVMGRWLQVRSRAGCRVLKGAAGHNHRIVYADAESGLIWKEGGIIVNCGRIIYGRSNCGRHAVGLRILIVYNEAGREELPGVEEQGYQEKNWRQ